LYQEWGQYLKQGGNLILKNGKALIYASLVALIGIFLIGCATTEMSGSSASASQSDLLQQAGFRTYTAKTAKDMTYIQTLPVKKVVLNEYENKPLYLVCTDPEGKTCFLGDKAAYQRYQDLATKVCLAEGQCKVSEHRWDPEALQMWASSQGAGG
jgi:hypothetical protein